MRIIQRCCGKWLNICHCGLVANCYNWHIKENTLSHFSNQTMFADIALADSSEKLSANQKNVKTFVKKEVQMYTYYSEFKVTETLQEEYG